MQTSGYISVVILVNILLSASLCVLAGSLQNVALNKSITTSAGVLFSRSQAATDGNSTTFAYAYPTNYTTFIATLDLEGVYEVRAVDVTLRYDAGFDVQLDDIPQFYAHTINCSAWRSMFSVNLTTTPRFIQFVKLLLRATCNTASPLFELSEIEVWTPTFTGSPPAVTLPSLVVASVSSSSEPSLSHRSSVARSSQSTISTTRSAERSSSRRSSVQPMAGTLNSSSVPFLSNTNSGAPSSQSNIISVPIILSQPNVTAFFIGTTDTPTVFVYSNLNAASLVIPLITVDGTAVLNGTLVVRITLDPSSELHDADVLDLIRYRSRVGAFDRIELQLIDVEERCEMYGGRVSYAQDKAFMVMTVDGARCMSCAREIGTPPTTCFTLLLNHLAGIVLTTLASPHR